MYVIILFISSCSFFFLPFVLSFHLTVRLSSRHLIGKKKTLRDVRYLQSAYLHVTCKQKLW
jgi:hypothetical protein